MTEISEAHKRQSKRTAAAAVAVVAVLSLAFIGLSFPDNAAGQVQTDSVSIEAVSSSEPFYTLLIGLTLARYGALHG
ncbi:MAG: hypothetical protein ACLT98_18735 [Eggerthellaceae bacterium]